MSYVIMINEDKSTIATNRETIMQRDKLVGKLEILIPNNFCNLDIPTFDLIMLYKLPISKKVDFVILKPEETEYKEGFCRYVLDVDTDITSEPGDVELQFSFISSSLDADGKNIQQSMGIKPALLHICELADWLTVSDEALGNMAQLYINNMNILKATEQLAQSLYEKKLDDIKIDIEGKRIVGVSNGNQTGEGISMEELANEIVETAGNSEGNIKLQVD